MDVAQGPKILPPKTLIGEAAAAVRADGERAVLVGLIGAGIAGSRMPPLHQAEAAAQGLACVYTRIDLTAQRLTTDALPALLAAARRFRFAGLNITHPCKQAVIPLLDAISPDAAAIGAVNTVVFGQDGRAVGYNTDRSGFAESFRRELGDVHRRHVVQLGAGGAGSAVAHALIGLGVERLSIVDTDEKRAEALAKLLGPCAEAADASVIAAADGIVNCTPVGMDDHPGTPIPTESLNPRLWVADIIYFPMETALLRAARARGCRTMGGGGMAVFQAVGAFRLFTGIEPDAERMLRHFESL